MNLLMMKVLRTSCTMALLVLTCAASADAVDSTPADQGFVANASGAAGNMLSRLPESGALLLWGSGLAAASLVIGRKRNDSQE